MILPLVLLLSIPRPLEIVLPPKPALLLQEERTSVLRVKVRGGTSARLFANELPPGAVFDSRQGTITFTPDFLQGGQSYELTLTATDGVTRTSTTVRLFVDDTRSIGAPTIVERTQHGDHERLRLQQVGDGFIEELGRTFEARLVVPTAATSNEPRPLRVYLHGIGGTPYDGGEGDEFRLYPHDPDSTYWAGRQLGGKFEPLTERRVMALVEWVLRTFPGADPERTYITGVSMGGTGAMTMGLRYARHFAFIAADLGQAVPRNHRPFRLEQLRALWGSGDAWDGLDVTRLLAGDRDVPMHLRYGKDDPTIHFGAFVLPSPLTRRSLRQTLTTYKIAHRVVWDEGGHGPPDPRLGARWWDPYDPLHDPVAFVRRDQPFVAFTDASIDANPGSGTARVISTSTVTPVFDPAKGFAGVIEVPFDTGWDGDIVGEVGAHLRFDARSIVDELERFEVEVFVSEEGLRVPRALPEVVLADVTIRRARSFRLDPNERVIVGSGTVEAQADRDGTLTLFRVPVSRTSERISIRRAPRSARR